MNKLISKFIFIGNKIIFSQNDGIKITNTDGTTLTFPNVNQVLNLQQFQQSMWSHAQQCLKYCYKIEETLTDLSKTLNNTGFPVIIGRRPTSTINSNGDHNRNGKENNWTSNVGQNSKLLVNSKTPPVSYIVLFCVFILICKLYKYSIIS